MAGVVVLEKQPCPQRSPLLMASLIAAVSSVMPSPDVWYQYRANGRPLRVRLTFCAKVLDVTEHPISGRSQGCDTLVRDGL